MSTLAGLGVGWTVGAALQKHEAGEAGEAAVEGGGLGRARATPVHPEPLPFTYGYIFIYICR